MPNTSLQARDQRPPLSCYIRTKNEASRIEATVKSALQVAREVVVVDSGSTDETRSIAEAAGARVIVNPWPGNGHQKRFAEEAATHDWLLDLDADEVVTEPLAKEIAALFDPGTPSQSVYAIPMALKVPVAPVWTNFFITYRNKLYDKRNWRMPAHAAWDQLELPGNVRPPQLTELIIHYHFTEFGQLVTKMNSVSSTRARYARKRSLT
ncbi:MAG: glycosyltransferase family 2 protein, partial [Pseudomonadota bacterium]